MDSFVLKAQAPRRKSDSMDWGGGAKWFAFVSSAGISTGHKFSRGLIGTRQYSYRNSIFPD